MVTRKFNCEVTSNQLRVIPFKPNQVLITLNDLIIILTKKDAEQLMDEIHNVLYQLEEDKI